LQSGRKKLLVHKGREIDSFQAVNGRKMNPSVWSRRGPGGNEICCERGTRRKNKKSPSMARASRL